MTRVGALRPLKFARHLPAFGWAPVVLADLRPEEAVDPRLTGFVPATTTVIHDYGRHARVQAEAVASGEARAPTRPPPPAAAGRPKRARLLRPRRGAEDFNPLGRHAFGIPYALRSARAALEQHSDCEAIVVNADPNAALLVGARLARETGKPLILDLRDPWSRCELRRPLWPRPQRVLVDRLERRAVEAAARVILNTETTRRDYRAHYDDLPAERFACIRNHADPELIAHGHFPPFDRFTVLFLGNFRRFVEGGTVVDALARLRSGGIGPDQLGLAVSGSIPQALRDAAREAGVADMIEDHPFVPYLEVGALMARADLLLSFSHPTAQRIPAKVFDYLVSDRRVAVVADNPELAELVSRAGGASVHPLADAAGLAAALAAAHAEGRGVRVERSAVGIDSRRASERLAVILDQVCG